MISSFFAGAFFFNSIPHITKGISGQTHMTPFKRVSSASLNVFWGFINLALAVFLLKADISANLSLSLDKMGSFLIGGFLMALADAWLFGKPDARLPWHKD
jgi:hypothetical protein